MHIEREFKLTLLPEAVLALRQHPLLAGRPKKRHLKTVYFDTQNHTFLRHGYTLRVRSTGRQWIQTLKSENKTASILSVRSEWEHLLKSEIPDLNLIKKIASQENGFAKLFKTLTSAESKIKPLFVTDILRTQWKILPDETTEIEISLDIGEIRAGRRITPVAELELELKSGSLEVLFEIVERLLSDIPMQFESLAKSARGYALLKHIRPKAQKAGLTLLKSRMTRQAACAAILRNNLQHLELNERAIIYKSSSEGVHQLRVSTRRLRSALKLFKAVLPRDWQSHIQKELKWLMRELEQARSWDVFINETLLALLPPTKDDQSIKMVLKIGRQLQHQGYERVRNALKSTRYNLLKLYLAKIQILDLTSISEGVVEEAVEDFARRALKSQHQKLLKAGHKHCNFSLSELHQLRIHCKKLRYTVEFFQSFYDKKITKGYLKSLSAMQSVLGSINDAAVGGACLSEIQRKIKTHQSSQFNRAEAIIFGWNSGKIASGITEFSKLWRKFEKQSLLK